MMIQLNPGQQDDDLTESEKIQQNPAFVSGAHPVALGQQRAPVNQTKHTWKDEWGQRAGWPEPLIKESEGRGTAGEIGN